MPWLYAPLLSYLLSTHLLFVIFKGRSIITFLYKSADFTNPSMGFIFCFISSLYLKKAHPLDPSFHIVLQFYGLSKTLNLMNCFFNTISASVYFCSINTPDFDKTQYFSDLLLRPLSIELHYLQISHFFRATPRLLWASSKSPFKDIDDLKQTTASSNCSILCSTNPFK